MKKIKLLALSLILAFSFIAIGNSQTVINSYRYADPILDGVVISYQFEENSSTLFDDLGVHDGTHNGATFTASGRTGNGYIYDGINDWSDIDYHSDFLLPGPATIGQT